MSKIVLPDFNNSILNVSATLLNYLGKNNGFAKIAALEAELNKNFKNVIFVIFDGLGMEVLKTHLDSDAFLIKHIAQTVTSVFPSTTTNATTTLMTATCPANHGWFGWALDFEEKNKIVELYNSRDYYTFEILEEDFAFKNLPFKPFFVDADLKQDIEIFSLFPTFVTKGLTKNNFSFSKIDEFFEDLDIICKLDGKKFVYSYCNEPDKTMHQFGVSSKTAKANIHLINSGFEKLVTENKDCLFVITADHGHLDIKEIIEIYNDKEIISCLKSMPSMEPRATAFFCKKDMKSKFKKSFTKYAADFDLYESAELIDKGVFGKFQNEKYKKFLGDFIAVGKDTNKMFLFSNETPRFKGHHTGLTESEMVLPLIIANAR